jgi:sugar/nucleoside kinase (ribokinase family)
MSTFTKRLYDCVVAGSCVVDLLCRPVDLQHPVGAGTLHRTGPLRVEAGGITANSGITMSRLGMRTAVCSCVGDDAWQSVLLNLFETNGVDTEHLIVHPTEATSTTVVMIADNGERSFLHCVGAPRTLDASVFLDRMDLWHNSRCILLGYYSLMPRLEPQLPTLFAKLRKAGCMTAMDAAGDGGTMDPLERILPHLCVYVPSRSEAEHQTGLTDPKKIVDAYRDCGAPYIIGVKLGGNAGVLLSAVAGEYVHVPSCTPPGPVVDTTGAGDSFYAGLLTGLLRGMSLEDSGRLGCAAAACCVTAVGGNTGGKSLAETMAIAGLED